MTRFSTTQAAKKLGIALSTLSRYISDKKIPSPEIVEIGGLMVHSWTEEEIEKVRQLLPKIANGRKTRWQKLREKQKTQARVPAPHKTKKKK
jgi:predicted DNA-binding transcriptional regulator AlpA